MRLFFFCVAAMGRPAHLMESFGCDQSHVKPPAAERSTTTSPWTAVRAFAVPGLAAALSVLQALDWHSSAVAGPVQYEANRLMNRIASFLTFEGALALIKVLDLAVVWALFLVWKRSPVLNAVFTLFFAALVVVYAGVVVNNYFAK